MERNIRFIHAADLHLDSPFKGLTNLPGHLFQEIKDSTFQALTHLVEAAIEYEVDFVLITGDLFDNEKQSLKAQIHLRKAFERLQKHRISVFISYGNHDFINGNVHQVTYPDNVHIFPDEQVRSFVYEKNGEPLARVYGFSYVNRAVTENKSKEYEVENRDIPFHIAMLHGSVQGDEEHDPYAPFQISDLDMKGFDYWALGHIHKRAVLKEEPYIVYPGNTQGRHRKETGEKGCYYVQLASHKTDVTFIPLQEIEFTNLSVDASSLKEIFDLEAMVLENIKQLKGGTPRLIDINLTGQNSELKKWKINGQLDELIDIINESLSNQIPWRYIFNVAVSMEERLAIDETSYGEHFFGELKQIIENTDGLSHLQELYQHRQARKYLDLPTRTEEKVWKQEAGNRLFDELLKGASR